MIKYSFFKHLEELGVDYGDSLLVAVSGGADSMVMLHALLNCKLELKVTVAHVNFNLRGEESNGDTQFVKEYCQQHNIPILIESFNTIDYATKNRLSIEMAARELRYNWFDTLYSSGKYKALAVAHNSNDNAETLLLNLTRGCGIEGLCGIPIKREYIIRPLIYYTRAEIEKYAQLHKIEYRIDSTNRDIKYSRNRIRNNIITQLAEINPSIIKTLNNNISLFRKGATIIENISIEKRKLFETVFNTNADLTKWGIKNNTHQLNIRFNTSTNGPVIKSVINIERLMQESEWELWLYYTLKEYNFSPTTINDIAKSISTDNENRYNVKRFSSNDLDNNYIAVKERGNIKIYKREDIAYNPIIINNIPKISNYKWGNISIYLERTTAHTISKEKMWLLLDSSKISFPITIRQPQPGDYFTPFSNKGGKKLKDYLTDIKIDNLNKENTPILVDANNKIIAIIGAEISSLVATTANSTNFIKVSLL